MPTRAESSKRGNGCLVPLDVPAGWVVLCDTELAGGWLGSLATSLAVLGPGPPGHSLHRAQLVVFVVSSAAEDARIEAQDRVGLAAAAEIPEAWLVDEGHGWTEVFRAPLDGRYRSRQICYPGERIRPLALPRTEVVPIPKVNRRCAR